VPETEYELPGMDDFVLTAGEPDELVWMQCRICFNTWQVVNLADALHQWNEHICKEKVR
jgi:hypothetical protein